MDDIERPSAIAQRIVDAIETEAENGEDIFEGLRRATVFYLSGFCPDCRKKVAKHLQRMVQHTIADANVMADAFGEPERHMH